MSHRAEKKQKFVKGAQSKEKSKLVKYFLPATLAVIVLSATVFFFLPRAGDGVGKKIKTNVSYQGKTIEMTEISADLRGGKIIVPLQRVKENKLVYFEYKGSQTIPLLAYLSPSGRMVVAVSMCEPCKSTRFHIKDDTLVCNACGTVWEIDTLEGISGGCLDYPPDVLDKVKILKDKILADESEVSRWKPRV